MKFLDSCIQTFIVVCKQARAHCLTLACCDLSLELCPPSVSEHSDSELLILAQFGRKERVSAALDLWNSVSSFSSSSFSWDDFAALRVVSAPFFAFFFLYFLAPPVLADDSSFVWGSDFAGLDGEGSYWLRGVGYRLSGREVGAPGKPWNMKAWNSTIQLWTCMYHILHKILRPI